MTVNLVAKITAKITKALFDGVPEDCVAALFLPGMNKPIHVKLSDIEIEDPEPPMQQVGYTVKNADGKVVASGTWTMPPGTLYALPQPWYGTDINADSGGGNGYITAMSGFSVTKLDAEGNPVTKVVQPKVSGNDVAHTLLQAVPGLAAAKGSCPACKKPQVETGALAAGFVTSWCGDHISAMDLVVHLNDYHEWSREQIADWLETKDWDLSFQQTEGADA